MRRIFEYNDYRLFLRDFYEFRKKSAEKFSLQRFARMAGFQSAGFLKMILDGKRNLSHEGIRKMSEALAFNKDESHYFTNLVLLNQSRSTDEKKYYAEQLLRSRGYKEINPLKSAQYDFYTHWYCVAIQQLVAVKGFQEDPQWIAKALRPQITPREARTALDLLIELKLIERDKDSRLALSQRALSTGDEVDSTSVADFHRAMLKRASESIDRFEAAERDVSSLTFSAGPETAKEVKGLIQDFRKKLMAILLASSEEPEDVHELNFQFFPLSRATRVKHSVGGVE